MNYFIFYRRNFKNKFDRRFRIESVYSDRCYKGKRY